MTFNGPNISRDIGLGEVQLEPNTDYTIDVTATQEFKEFALTVDLLAWAGPADAEPKLMHTCEGSQSGRVDFFPLVELMSGFSSKGKFLDSHTYCGETSVEEKTNCVGRSTPLRQKPGSPNRVECTAEGPNQIRNYVLSFNPAQDQTELVCKKNENIVHSETFRNCRTVITDYAKYKSDLDL